MKLKDLLESLNKMVEINPQLLEIDLAYSVDDEGNEFMGVNCIPSISSVEDLNAYVYELTDESLEAEDYRIGYQAVLIIN